MKEKVGKQEQTIEFGWFQAKVLNTMTRILITNIVSNEHVLKIRGTVS